MCQALQWNEVFLTNKLFALFLLMDTKLTRRKHKTGLVYSHVQVRASACTALLYLKNREIIKHYFTTSTIYEKHFTKGFVSAFTALITTMSVSKNPH